MLKFDHVVVHANGGDQINEWKQQLDQLQVAFEPSWGKKAAGFQITNIWIGQQYFEIVDLSERESAWQKQWVKRHNEGDRGAFCIFFELKSDIDAAHAQLSAAGILCSAPERTEFKWFFGMMKKRVPWRFMLLPALPGTNIEIGLIQYDAGAREKNEPFFVPNCKEQGFVGLKHSTLNCDAPEQAKAELQSIENALGEEFDLRIKEANSHDEQIDLQLTGVYEPSSTSAGFRLANVEVVRPI